MATLLLAACLPGQREGQELPGTAPGATGFAVEIIEAAPIGAAPVPLAAPAGTLPDAGQSPEAALAIAATPAAQGGGIAAAAPPLPRPATGEPAATTPVEAAPAPPSSPEAQLCLKTGGLWVKVGTGALMTCVRPTRDAGKACRSAGDCEGLCLARSMTCAPYDPLFGCNEILQADGSRITFCLQ